MTATATNVGTITQIFGPVVDVRFSAGQLPAIYSALKFKDEALGIDLREIDFAVLSHTHFDHISGFDHVLKVNPKLKIYFPPDPFWGAPLPFDATGRDAEAGQPGLVTIHDLSNTGSVAALMTADLGTWVASPGQPGFDVLGRQPGAEERGCSIAADMMVAG